MKEIAKLFYESYLKHNYEAHTESNDEFDLAERNFLKELSKAQYDLFLQYEMYLIDHIADREIRIIEYIFDLLNPED